MAPKKSDRKAGASDPAGQASRPLPPNQPRRSPRFIAQAEGAAKAQTNPSPQVHKEVHKEVPPSADIPALVRAKGKLLARSMGYDRNASIPPIQHKVCVDVAFGDPS